MNKEMDKIHQLFSKGKKQGYILFEEIDKTFKDNVDDGKNFDEFINSIDSHGIKILYKRNMIGPKRKKNETLKLGSLGRTADPVKLYLKEMGSISLLTREGEIAIAKQIERSEKDIIRALSNTRLALNEVFSLEERIKEDLEVIQGMFDFSEDEDIPSPPDTVIHINMIEQIEDVLKTIPEREAKVLKMRFGLGDGNEHTLEEIGDQFKVTRERIRQIETKALRKLKHPNRREKLESFADYC